tara:strand:- start:701 stop:931 length:231 start_codon:yes stop_codon:yes gene_type:complete
MNRILLFVTIFSFGYMFNDVLKEFDLKLINEAKADTDVYDVIYSSAFESAVEDIVEDCKIRGHVDDGYLHSSKIRC